ncbi:MAG TPA: hypothetical protein VGC83_01400, partial [Solirubrobacteraceae bacterium]
MPEGDDQQHDGHGRGEHDDDEVGGQGDRGPARALNAFGLPKQVRPAIYDGDTRREERLAIRRRANLVLTNPDMLHVGILPNHAAWADFFANLA